MRKSLLSIVAGLAIIGTVSAQEDSRTIGTTTKKGANILPAAGDIAIGVDAAPFLGYAGNFFTNANNNSPEFGQNGAIVGKYFLTDKSAIRARVDFGFGSNKFTTETPSATNPDVDVKNTLTEKENNLALTLGYELRRGYGRLQGYYGAEVGLGFSNNSESFTYGNPITATNPGPRTLSEKFGSKFGFGLGGFVGVEYFVASKISIGGELGLGLGFDSSKAGKETTEEWDNGAVTKTTIDKSGNKNNNFNVETRTNGRLMLSFHF